MGPQGIPQRAPESHRGQRRIPMGPTSVPWSRDPMEPVEEPRTIGLGRSGDTAGPKDYTDTCERNHKSHGPGSRRARIPSPWGQDGPRQRARKASQTHAEVPAHTHIPEHTVFAAFREGPVQDCSVFTRLRGVPEEDIQKNSMKNQSSVAERKTKSSRT